MAKIKALPGVDFAIVSREDHKDAEGEHLHCMISFKKQQNKSGHQWLDDLAGKHGNYQAARNLTDVIQYVVKDGDYVCHNIDPTLYLSQRLKKKSTKGSKSGEISAFIKEHADATIDTIDDMDSGFVLTNKRKLQEYISYQQAKRMKLNLLPWVQFDLDRFPNADFNFKIAKWVNENVKTPREFKQKQLFIWSEGPNTGKTHLIMELSKYLAVFHVPKTKFCDGYESGRFDLVVCDEFKAHFTIQFLNEFLQGSKMHLDQKGSGTWKTDNPPMIFLSNFSLDDCYHRKQGTGSLDALKARFKQVKIPMGKKIDLWFTLDNEGQ